MFRQIHDRHITCDFCGALTRARVHPDEPDVVRCGSCHYPLSEGEFSGKKKEKTHRKLSGKPPHEGV